MVEPLLKVPNALRPSVRCWYYRIRLIASPHHEEPSVEPVWGASTWRPELGADREGSVLCEVQPSEHRRWIFC